MVFMANSPSCEAGNTVVVPDGDMGLRLNTHSAVDHRERALWAARALHDRRAQPVWPVLWPQQGDKGTWRDGQWHVCAASTCAWRNNATTTTNSASPCLDAPCPDAPCPDAPRPEASCPDAPWAMVAPTDRTPWPGSGPPKTLTGSRCMRQPETPLGHRDGPVAAAPRSPERPSTPGAWAADHHFRTFQGAGNLAHWSPAFRSRHARLAGGQGTTSTLEAGAWTTNRWQGKRLW